MWLTKKLRWVNYEINDYIDRRGKEEVTVMVNQLQFIKVNK
jgi:hypothetical protein